MSHAGHCYCGQLRYEFDGDAMMKAQCHCRECQYISGGAVLNFMVVPSAGFKWTQGSPKTFTRSDLDHAVTRGFCENCGTHITTEVPALEGAIGPSTIPASTAGRTWRSSPVTSRRIT